MTRIVGGLLLLLGLAVPVLACSAHGTIAGDKVDTWLDSGDDNQVGNTGFSVTGTSSATRAATTLAAGTGSGTRSR